MRRRSFMAAAALTGIATGTGTVLAAETEEQSESGAWSDIKESLFQSRPIADGTGGIALDAPARALDAAIVPMTITLAAPQAPNSAIRTVWLIIDENPAPVATIFHLHEPAIATRIQTRVRVNSYTSVHAIAETADGRLLGVERFVKAAGGCSAPAMKDPAEMEARRGRMKLKPLTPFTPNEPNEVQLLISHPQYTGMQIDQLSRNWIPPDYLRRIDISFEGVPVMEIESDISLSEDPSLTFPIVPARPGILAVKAVDSKGRDYEGHFPLGSGS
jgi:sulfur-oxidizing protein SoxY